MNFPNRGGKVGTYAEVDAIPLAHFGYVSGTLYHNPNGTPARVGGGAVQVLSGATDPPTTPPDDPDSAAVYYTAGSNPRQYNWNPDTEEWDFFADAGSASRLGTLFDWTTRPAGALPAAEWTASNWTNGATGAVCAPTLGSELIQDANTRNPTTGIGDWVAQGTNSVTADAGELVVTYGNSGNGAILTLSDAGGLTGTLAWPRIYRLTFDYRRTAGSGNDHYPFINNGSDHAGLRPLPQGNAVVGRRLDWQKWVENNLLYMPFGLASGMTIRAGNFSIKEIDIATCLAIYKTAAPTTVGSITVKAGINSTPGQGGMAGVVARANSATAPTSYIYARVTHDVVGSKVEVCKCIEGTHSRVSSASSSVFTLDDAEIELQCATGGVVRLFVDNVQVGSNYTISDASLGDYYGMFSTGADVSIRSWWLGATPSDCLVAAFGGSVTKYGYSTAPADGNLYYVAQGLRRANPDRNVRLITGAENGHMAHNHLERYLSGFLTGRTPQMIYLDFTANHAGADTVFGEILEGFIRRIRKDFAAATLISPINPYWDNSSAGGNHLVGTLYNDVGIAWVVPLLENYGILLSRVDLALLAEIAASPLGEQVIWPYYNASGTDGVHPSTRAGIARYAEIIGTDFIRSRMQGGASPYSGTITDYPRIYAGSAYWEDLVQNYVTKTGWTETGTWADMAATDLFNVIYPEGYSAETPGRTTSTAGSKLSCTLTGRWAYCRSRRDQTGTVRWRINGGDWTNFTPYPTAVQYSWFWNNTAPNHSVATESLLELELVSGTMSIQRIGML